MTESGQPRSLRRLTTGRPDIPVVLALSTILLAAGLWLPVMKVETLVFWEDSYTLLSGSYNLARDGDWFLAAVLFIFSVLFPISKLGALIVVYFRPLDAERREKLIGVVSQLGKWSMLDVFVIAFLVVLTKSKALGGIAAQPGLVCFTLSVLLSMVGSMQIERAARARHAPT